MSDITTKFRMVAGDAVKDISDDNLAVFIGNHYPNLLTNEEFKAEFDMGQQVRQERTQQRQRDEAEIKERNEHGGLWGTIAAGLGAGAANLEKSYGGIASFPGSAGLFGGVAGVALNLTGGSEKLAKQGADLEKQYQAAMGFRAGNSTATKFAGQLASGVVSMLPSAAAAFFGGLPAAAVAAGMQQLGSTYVDAQAAYKAKGEDDDTAKFKAAGPAIVTGITTGALTAFFGQFGGAERLLADLGKGKVSIETGKQLLNLIWKTGGIEGVEEGVDQTVQGFVERYTYNPSKPPMDILKESIMAAAIGGTLGVVVGGGGGLVAKFSTKPEQPIETVTQPAPAGTTAETMAETPEQGVIVKELPEIKPVEQGVQPELINKANLLTAIKDKVASWEAMEQGGTITDKQRFLLNMLRPISKKDTPTDEDYQNAANLWDLKLDENAQAFPRRFDYLNPAGAATTASQQPAAESVPAGGKVEPTVTPAPKTGETAAAAAQVTEKGPLYDADVALVEQTKPGEQIRVSPRTSETKSKSEGLLVSLKDGDTVTNTDGTSYIVKRFKSKKSGTEQISFETQDGDQVGGNSLFKNGKWKIDSDSLVFVERGLITRKSQPAPTPAATTAEVLGTQPAVAPTTTAELNPQLQPTEGAVPGIAMIGMNPKLLNKVNDFYNWATPRKGAAPPVIQPSGKARLPKLPATWSTLKKAFTRPFAAGKIPILGLAIDPNARHLTFVGEAINTYWAVRGTGHAISGTLGLELKGKLDNAFKVTNGELNVKRNSNNPNAALYTSLAPSDVFEALQVDPNAYILTKEQWTAYDEANKVLDEVKALRKHYGLTKPQAEEDELDPNEYFPRIVIDAPKPTAKKGGGGGAKVGGKPGYTKSRVFSTESEGVAKGWKYEPSMEKRLVSMVDRVYKEIADQQLSEDPDLGGIRKQIFRDQIRAYLANTGKTGDALEQAVDNATTRGSVHDQPAFQKYVYDPDVAAELTKAFPKTSDFLAKFNDVNGAIKLMQLGFDWGVMFNQGVVLMFSHPKQWATAVKNSTKAFFDDTVLAKYANDNIELMRKAAQLGMSFGRLPEYLSRYEGSKGVEKIPYVGKALEPFMRQFETFMDVGKVELLKSYWDVVEKTHPEQLMQLVKSIESVTMSSRMESIGIRTGQAALERAAMMAPSYYRGGLNLVAMLGEGGISSRIAVRALGSYMAGGVALFAGLGFAVGMNWDEISDRLDPRRGDFMMWKVKLPNGNTLNIGFGGFLKSLVRLGANIYDTVARGRIAGFAKFTSEDNPIARWFRAHSASLPSLTWDALTGRDYLGDESYAGVLFGRMLPFAVQDAIGREGTKKRGALETGVSAGLSFTGLQTYQESFPRERQAALDKMAREQYGKRFSEISLGQKNKLVAKFELTPTFTQKAVASEKQIQLAVKREQENAKDINRYTTPGARKVLEDLELRLPGQANLDIKLGGRTIPMSDDERDQFKRFVADEYSKMILKFEKRLEASKSKELLFKNVLENSRKRAKLMMLRQLKIKGKE